MKMSNKEVKDGIIKAIGRQYCTIPICWLHTILGAGKRSYNCNYCDFLWSNKSYIPACSTSDLIGRIR